MKPLSKLAALVFFAALSGWMSIPKANAQTNCECCPLGLPSAPNNLIDFTLNWAYPPSVSDSFLTATVETNGAMSPGVYASWCVDAQTSLLPGIQGYGYSGSVYGSTDPNLNQFLVLDTDNTNTLVNQDVWKEVNYILNHRAGYNYWDVQGAIWHFIGGPAVATPPYPYFNQEAVSQLVSDTISNAPAWVPQLGNKVAVVVALTWPQDNQIIIIEMPCPGTTPSLAVSINCPTDCGLAVFSGSVSNSGNVTLANVFVLSSQPSDNSLVLGPLSLAPGAAAVFAGSYVIPCITNVLSNTVEVVTTNTASVISTNTFGVITTNMVGVITTNLISTVSTNTIGQIITNIVSVVTTNTVGVVITNTTVAVVTNVLSTIATNAIDVITTNVVTVVMTNTVGVVTTNTIIIVTTNVVPIVATNAVSVVSTNTTFVVTTNNTITVTTNTTGTIHNTAVASTFGTISPAGSIGTVTDRFVVGTNFYGLTFSDSDHGYGATTFYSIHNDSAANVNFFDTIAPTGSTGTTMDRFILPQYSFDALTYAAPDMGYGPIIFYYLRHDAIGLSTFGTITPGGVVGVVADEKVVGTNFDALTFSATDVGYGANLFYYVRHDTNCNSIFGTIDPAQGGPVTDRFTIGEGVDALVFTATDVGYGADNFYYLRHDSAGNSTFGTIFVTGLINGNVTDRFGVGTNVAELCFTTTDVLYGPNLFYYLRGTPKSGCAQVTFTTNSITSFATNSVIDYTTNIVFSLITNNIAIIDTNMATSFNTNIVTSFSTNSLMDFTTNKVTSYITNTVSLFITNTLTAFSTNILTEVSTNNVIDFATNNAISFVTNTVTIYATNMVADFATNTVTSFGTNSFSTFITNGVITYNTNMMAAATTNLVTASGTDVCQARTVTATANCSGAAGQFVPLIIGGGGVPQPHLSNGNFNWSFITQSQTSYVVQYKASLGDPLWTDLQTVAGTGKIVTISDAVAGRTAGFYRIKSMPQ